MKDWTSELESRAGPVSPLAAKLVGGVMLWFGIAAIGLLLWFSYKVVSLDRPTAFGAIVFLGVLSIIGLFCLSVGWRLFWNRPNRYGTILSPMGWRILGGILFALFPIAVAGFIVMFISNDYSFYVLSALVTSLLLYLVFCFWCFRAARRAAARATNANGAL